MARLTLDWIQIAELLGMLQGVLLAAVLVAQLANRTANRLLAALILSFALYLGSSVYYGADLVAAYPHFFGISYPLPWVFGPLVYLYSKAASDRAWRIERRDLAHFLPFALTTLSALPYFMMRGAEKVAAYDRLMAGHVPARIALIEPTKYLSGIAYSVATIVYLRGHRRRIEESYSNIARVNLRWLLWLAGGAAGVWIIATLLKVTDFDQRLREDHVSLAMAVMVYGIGFMGLRQPEVFRYETAEMPIPEMPIPEMPIPRVPVASPQPADEPVPVTNRYERSGLSDEEAAELERSLLAVMERDAPWKNSELTLADLAAMLGSTPHKLSEVLNARVGRTFYDFVNGYRVREVQRRIEAGDAQRLKMLAIALDAGFASKSTFNDAFKRHTSVTPSSFRKSVGAT
jgi:AraC-like DNA-binding protein